MPHPLILAHRGASALAPENTLAAFKLARDIGANGFECDVQLSKDGVPMVFHDDSLKRCTGSKGAISDFTVRELKQLDAGSWKNPRFKGERIPTLEEVLELCGPNFYGLVELKEGEPTDLLLSRKSVRMASQCKHAGVCTYSGKMLSAARDEVRGIWAQLICEPWTPGRWKKALALAQELKLNGLGVNYHYLTKARVKQAQSLGLEVGAWTVNRKGALKRMGKYGVNALETDSPDIALMEFLP